MNKNVWHVTIGIFKLKQMKNLKKNTLFRNTGYMETGYNKLRIPYYIMWQLVKTNRFINNGNL